MDEKIVDIRDIFIELIRSRILIFALTIVLTLLMVCFGALRTGVFNKTNVKTEESSTEEAYQASLDEAAALLTSDEKAEVERLNNQLKSYIDYRKQYQDLFTGFLKTGDDLENSYLVKRVSYNFRSKLEGAESMMSTMSMGVEDYRKILDILPELDNISDAYNFVNIWALSGNETLINNLGDETILPSRYMICFEVVGNNEEVCNQMEEVVDAALHRELSELRKIDSEALLEKTSAQFNGNINQYFATKKQATFDYIQKIDTTIYNLRNNYIDKLSPEQKEYYNILKDSEYTEETENDGSSKKTFIIFAVAGILIGFIFGCLIVVIKYLISGTININDEIEDYFNLSVIGTYYEQDKKRNVFSGWIKKLCGADDIDLSVKTALIAADINGMMKKAHTDSLYFIQTAQEAEDMAVSNDLSNAVIKYDPNNSVVFGNPLKDPDEVDRLTQKENVLLLVHTKKTMRKDIERLMDLCSRQAIKVLGAVSIVDV